MEVIKIKTCHFGIEGFDEYEVLTFQINENGLNGRGEPAECKFCKKSMKPNSVAYDWRGDGWTRGGYTFCAKSHMKNWLKINKGS